MCSRPAAEIDSGVAYTNRLPQVGKVEANMSFEINCSG
jgi:hypothetical protein